MALREIYVSPEEIEHYMDLVEHGDSVRAIKECRISHNVGLKEAKIFIRDNECKTPCVVDAVRFTSKASPIFLMKRLFELTAEIAEIHKKLENVGDT